ncbi:MAG: hypothetical protein O7I42_21000 [Alphaproteobacteria bacterium]|nr:hypothetical protein [Alphaproteobacteria bacterium]
MRSQSQTFEPGPPGQRQQHISEPDIQWDDVFSESCDLLGRFAHQDEELTAPKEAGSDTLGAETIHLWQAWEVMRRGMRFPVLGTHIAELCRRFRDSVIILDLRRQDSEPTVSFAGRMYCKGINENPAGSLISELEPGSPISQITTKYHDVVADEAPVAFPANCEGIMLPMNFILLPFSKDGDTLCSIFCVGVPNEKFCGKISSVAPIDDDSGSPHNRPQGDKQEDSRLVRVLEECRSLARTFEAGTARSTEQLYDVLKKAYELWTVAQELRIDYNKLCADIGIKVQKRAPFTPVLKLVFGKDYDRSRLSEYAACISYAKRMDQSPSTLVGFITTTEGGIKGCAKAERELSGSAKRHAPRNLDTVYERLRNVPRIASFSCEIENSGDEFYLLLGRKCQEDNNMIEVIQILDEKTLPLKRVIEKINL